jgi:hypothetical protein
MGIDYIQHRSAKYSNEPQVAFCSQHPHTTWQLRVVYPVTAKPTKLLGDLAVAGWVEESDPIPPSDGIQAIYVSCPGTDLFGSWRPKERESAIGKCRKVLANNGYKAVPHFELSMADCL